MDLPELHRIIAALQSAQIARLRTSVASADAAPVASSEHGFAGELAVAIDLRGAALRLLPRRARRWLNNFGHGGDYGADVVVIEGNGVALLQVKRCQPGTRIGYEAVAKLRDLADGLERRGIAVECVMAFWPGVTLTAGQPQGRHVEVLEFSDDTIDRARTRRREPPHAADRTAHQAATAAAAMAAATGGKPVTIRAPCGYGKSYLIRLIVQELLARAAATGTEPCIVVTTPRTLITEQLAGLLGDAPVVDGRRPWAHAPVVLVEAQSASKVPAGVMTALIRDESHINAGSELIYAAEGLPRFSLSATVAPADVVVCPREIWELGYVCRPQFCCAVFDAEPGPGGWAQYFADCPEHQSVLVCCKTQTEAVVFAETFNARWPGSAAAFVSQQHEAADLAQFRDGTLRFLCVVCKVEMGVDVHRCDTVLFAHPWLAEEDRAVRLHRAVQLLGRGTRRHASKSDHYHALFGCCVDGAPKLLKHMTQLAMHTLAPPPNSSEWMADHFEVRAAGPAAGRAANAAPGGAPEIAAEHAAQSAALVHRMWLSELGTAVDDHRALYRIDCQQMAQAKDAAGLPVFAEWERCAPLAHFLPPECVVDPEEYYHAHKVPFRWREFLGWPMLSLQEIRHRFRSIAEGSAAYDISPHDVVSEAMYDGVARTRPDLLPPKLKCYDCAAADL